MSRIDNPSLAENGGAYAQPVHVAAAGTNTAATGDALARARGTLRSPASNAVTPAGRRLLLGRQQRLRLSAAATAAVLIAGCVPDTAPPTGPLASPLPQMPSPQDATARAEAAVLEAYRGMWEAYTVASRRPQADPGDPTLGRYATGDALDVLRRGLTAMRDQGLVTQGSMRLSPEVTDVTPASSPTRAQVSDCADTRDAVRVRADGEPFEDEPGGRRLIVADLEKTDGGWKVTSFGIRAVGSC